MDLLDRIKVRNMKNVLGLMAIPMFAVGFLLPKMENGYPWCMINALSGSTMVLGVSMLIFRISREGKRPFSTNAIICTRE